MINKVTLIGNLGKAPEVRRLDSGAVVAKFSLATNENYKDKNGEWQTITEWHQVVVWRSLAEKAEKQLEKGSMVYLDGKLTHRRWEDSNGNPRKTTEVVATYFRVINKKRNENFPSEEPVNSNYVQPADVPASEAHSLQQQADTTAKNNDDDLPF